MKSTNLKKTTYTTVVFLFLNFSWKIFGAISIVVGVAGAFSNFEYFKSHVLITCIFVSVLTVFIAFILIIDKLIGDKIENNTPIHLSTELVRLTNTLYEEEKYLDVVRFGATISRYLWLNGHNHERILIGQLVEDAASKEGRLEKQISALIDDIGWTYYIIGETDKAIVNISNGIEMALDHNYYYFASKGERHLSGIEKHRGNQTGFLLHLSNAELYSAKIIDSSNRNEIDASLFLVRAKYLFETGNLEEAEALSKKVILIFENDPDRIVKIHSLLGNIFLKEGKIQKAKDEFNRGYNKSKSIRRDEVAKNAKGLADIALIEKDIKSCIKYLNEAKNIYTSLHKNKEILVIENLLNSIKV